MNTNDTAREARTRNLARLRRLTIGTAALSVAATSGFGWLAAMSTAATTTATTAYTTTSTTTNTSTSAASTSSTSASAAATAAPTVSAASGTAHVSSGGS